MRTTLGSYCSSTWHWHWHRVLGIGYSEHWTLGNAVWSSGESLALVGTISKRRRQRRVDVGPRRGQKHHKTVCVLWSSLIWVRFGMGLRGRMREVTQSKYVGKRAPRWHSISTFKAQFTTNIYNCQLATKQQQQQQEDKEEAEELRMQVKQKIPPTLSTSQSTSLSTSQLLLIFREPVMNCMQFVSIKQQTNFQLVCHAMRTYRYLCVYVCVCEYESCVCAAVWRRN